MRIDYKILSLLYSCMNGTAPRYLQELIPRYLPVCHLRSSTQSRLRIPSIDKGNKNKQNKNALESEHFPKLQQDLADRRMANPMDPVLSHHTSQERQSAAMPELPNNKPHQSPKQSHAEGHTE